MIGRKVYVLRVSVKGDTIIKVCDSEQIAANCLKELAYENNGIGMWSIEQSNIIECTETYPIVKSKSSLIHFKELFKEKPFNYKFVLRHDKTGKLVYYSSEMDMNDYSYTAYILTMQLLTDGNDFIIIPICKHKKDLHTSDISQIINYINNGILIPMDVSESSSITLRSYMSEKSGNFFDKFIYLKDIDYYKPWDYFTPHSDEIACKC